MAYYVELPKLHNLTVCQFDLDCNPDSGSDSNADPIFEIAHSDAAQERLISHTLHMHLCEMKEQIKECGDDTWDTIKKYTNPFEFIHTAIPNSKFYTVSKLRPLSRSFYKLIELHSTFFNELHEPKSMTSFHLAEGPGGFIEALIHVRSKLASSTSTIHCQNDVHYGMTLLNVDASCPGWKKSKGFLEMHRNRVCIETGADGTGNIISSSNFEHCASKYKNACHLITADGGFDFSCDFNNQETMVLRLLIAEMGFALALQQQGGHFILKMFDTFTKPTIDVIYVLCNFYQEVYVSKPCTSRYANSERYIVCKHFKPRTTDGLLPQLIAMFRQLEDVPPNATITSLLPMEHDAHFLNKIEECNAIIGQQQMETINATINLILNRSHADKLESMKRQNIMKCISWCDKHCIPYNRIMQNNNIFLK
jgi:23S rRNA U2552 (ribose-2'-O)-methylase RlmE/FtsJ